MKMHLAKMLPILLFGLVAALGAGCVTTGGGDTSYHPQIEPADFQAIVDNPYFPLVPGTTLKYVENALGEISESEVTVTHETKLIMGVQCVVVHDRIKGYGRLREETYSWYAQDKQGAVWQFGDATKEFKPGGRISTYVWEAGVRGAQPGIVMPGNPKPGKPYPKQYARDAAEDIAQIVALDDSVTAPAGSFTECVRTTEWSMLEAGTEKKWYAKGVGLVRAEATGGDTTVLVSILRP